MSKVVPLGTIHAQRCACPACRADREALASARARWTIQLQAAFLILAAVLFILIAAACAPGIAAAFQLTPAGTGAERSTEELGR